MIASYYSLSDAVLKTGRSESELIQLGIEGKLKFYVSPCNWGYRKENNPATAHIIKRLY
jgi:hypothetical protein